MIAKLTHISVYQKIMVFDRKIQFEKIQLTSDLRLTPCKIDQ